jgi:uncharacterized membrane protein YdfJ with MMPL/SSD domain
VLILLLTFGTAIAMGIPILTAILGLSVGLGVIAFLSHTVEVPTSAPTLASEISSKLPLVIGIVLSFMLLLLSFRSMLVPLKAMVMYVFSILAAFGVVTYAFSHD